jgi:hypothetical protein
MRRAERCRERAGRYERMEGQSTAGLRPLGAVVAVWVCAFLGLGVPGFAQPDPNERAPLGGISDLLSQRGSSQALKMSDCELERFGVQGPVMREPVRRVSEFGAVGDGRTDDTSAIERGVQSMVSGGTLVFDQHRTYLVRRNLVVRQPGLALWGYRAVLATVATPAELSGPKGGAQLSLRAEGDDIGIYGFTFRSNAGMRLAGHPNNGAVVIVGRRTEVVDNRFEYTHSGVLVRGGKDFVVARNVVFRTWADGIHVTTGSSGGRIVCNRVWEAGDDMIAIVNYGREGEPTVGNVLIEENELAGQYWGRGITVVGGRDVTIRGNRISQTTHGAAVLVASERFWKTADVVNVLVEDNVISDVQISAPSYNPRNDFRRTGQGAIDIFGQAGQRVDTVTVRNNVIDRAAKAGIRVRGTVCNVRLEGNRISRTRAEPVRIEPDAPGFCLPLCSGNTYQGRVLASLPCGQVAREAEGAKLR